MGQNALQKTFDAIDATLRELVFFLKKLSSSLGRVSFLGDPDEEDDDVPSALAAPGAPRGPREVLLAKVGPPGVHSCHFADVTSTTDTLY
eukprot:scaffold661438_cov59-Prasinocladus_malaysianus.AAC.1